MHMQGCRLLSSTEMISRRRQVISGGLARVRSLTFCNALFLPGLSVGASSRVQLGFVLYTASCYQSLQRKVLPGTIASSPSMSQ